MVVAKGSKSNTPVVFSLEGAGVGARRTTATICPGEIGGMALWAWFDADKRCSWGGVSLLGQRRKRGGNDGVYVEIRSSNRNSAMAVVAVIGSAGAEEMTEGGAGRLRHGEGLERWSL